MYFDNQEILPRLSGDYRYNKSGEKIIKFTSLEVEVRALIEGQFLAKRAYTEDFGFRVGECNIQFFCINKKNNKTTHVFLHKTEFIISDRITAFLPFTITNFSKHINLKKSILEIVRYIFR